MVEQCRSRGVLLMEAFMWRHQPRTLELRARVAAGLLGDLRLIRSSFSFPIEPGDWRLDPARGGGALWDVGCYGISTARFFTGAEPESVRARARFGPTGVDLTLTASLGFPNQYEAMIDAFATSLAAGRLVEPAEDGLAQMKALDAIMEAARS